jgi:hypothetical protein
MKHKIKCGNRGVVDHDKRLATVFLINGSLYLHPVARCSECYNNYRSGWEHMSYIQVTYEEYLVHEVLRS